MFIILKTKMNLPKIGRTVWIMLKKLWKHNTTSNETGKWLYDTKVYVFEIIDRDKALV